MEVHHCKQLLGTLADYIDGELTDALCADLERHLETCPNCTVVVNTLRKTIELYHTEVKTGPLPNEVRQRLFVRLELDEYIK
jgi:anti-sigma factor (TIGR02949 family)